MMVEAQIYLVGHAAVPQATAACRGRHSCSCGKSHARNQTGMNGFARSEGRMRASQASRTNQGDQPLCSLRNADTDMMRGTTRKRQDYDGI